MKRFYRFYKKVRNNLIMHKIIFTAKISRLKIEQRKQRTIQINYLKEKQIEKLKKIIVFLVPANDVVNGGVMSIFTIANFMRKHYDKHQAEVFVCTYPHNEYCTYYTKFKNEEVLIAFDLLLEKAKNLEVITLHCPEVFVEKLAFYMGNKYLRKIKKIKKAQLNILKQNKFVPKYEIELLKQFFHYYTCTTAHKKYCTQELADQLKMPVLHLSVKNMFANYTKVPFENRQNLLIYSPDFCELKERILTDLKKEIPGLILIKINNLTFDKYLELVHNAKWSITFGEGLDFYFYDIVRTGGISFAVYNSEYFTADYKNLPTIYESYDVMMQNIVNDINYLNNKELYQKTNQTLLSKLIEHYKDEEYEENIIKFLNNEFMFYPND
ncbi:MAG: hypothetical protein WHW07_01775 [Bacteroidales bacterium]